MSETFVSAHKPKSLLKHYRKAIIFAYFNRAIGSVEIYDFCGQKYSL